MPYAAIFTLNSPVRLYTIDGSLTCILHIPRLIHHLCRQSIMARRLFKCPSSLGKSTYCSTQGSLADCIPKVSKHASCTAVTKYSDPQAVLATATSLCLLLHNSHSCLSKVRLKACHQQQNKCGVCCHSTSGAGQQQQLVVHGAMNGAAHDISKALLLPTAAGGNKEYTPSAAVAKRLPSKWPRPVWHPPWKLFRVISGHLGCVFGRDTRFLKGGTHHKSVPNICMFVCIAAAHMASVHACLACTHRLHHQIICLH